MVLTTNQIEIATRGISKLKRLEDDVKNVVYIEPVLTPTIENEIQNFRDQIDAWISANPNRTRIEYITNISPLKQQLITKIQENEMIKLNNQSLINQTMSNYNSEITTKQSLVDKQYNIIINWIKSNWDDIA